MNKVNYLYIINLILSIVIVVASLYQPKTFNSDYELANIKCGLPLPFIEGASTRNPPFPFHTSCIEGFYIFPRENHANILWIRFFLDVTMVFGFLSLINYGYQQVGKKNGERKVGI